MADFLRLGFDVRTSPTEANVSADALVWPQAVPAYQAALAGGFKENSFELLQLASVDELKRLQEIVHAADPTAVVAEIAALELVAASQAIRWIDRTLDVFPIDDGAVALERYDACDLDGFFSAFDMGKASLRRGAGSSDDALLDACIVAQAANLLVPSHAPFVTLRIRVLKSGRWRREPEFERRSLRHPPFAANRAPSTAPIAETSGATSVSE